MGKVRLCACVTSIPSPAQDTPESQEVVRRKGRRTEPSPGARAGRQSSSAWHSVEFSVLSSLRNSSFQATHLGAWQLSSCKGKRKGDGWEKRKGKRRGESPACLSKASWVLALSHALWTLSLDVLQKAVEEPAIPWASPGARTRGGPRGSVLESYK